MAALQFTLHAVERYVARCAPHMSLAEARRHLDSCAASQMREKTATGQFYFQLPDCVAVVKFDPKCRRPVAVTIVPSGELIEEDELLRLRDEILAERAEVHARRLAIEAEPKSAPRLTALHLIQD